MTVLSTLGNLRRRAEAAVPGAPGERHLTVARTSSRGNGGVTVGCEHATETVQTLRGGRVDEARETMGSASRSYKADTCVRPNTLHTTAQKLRGLRTRRHGQPVHEQRRPGTALRRACFLWVVYSSFCYEYEYHHIQFMTKLRGPSPCQSAQLP